EGAQALDPLPALGLAALAPDGERRTEHRHLLAVAALAVEAGLLVELMAGRDGGKGIGLGAETGGEDLFAHPASVAALSAETLPPLGNGFLLSRSSGFLLSQSEVEVVEIVRPFVVDERRALRGESHRNLDHVVDLSISYVFLALQCPVVPFDVIEFRW